ncbi:MAG: hypothetical protein Q9160_006726 [Pyrenula sp. 1 TL-2023]
MLNLPSITLLLGIGSALVAAVPAPAPTAPAQLEERATTCTFTDAAAASKSKTSCSTVVLSNIAVPSGTTLDMTKLNSGTHVIFEGTTTFGYKEWAGPLVSVSGTDITVTGTSGSVLDGQGSRWWDGQGSNGGKTKPKFFYAHGLTTSTISGITIKNSPVQVFSVNGAKTLTLSGITIDNSAGDSQGGHNTDAFDVGSSDSVTISGANVKNQDDCLAINSGTNIKFTGGTCSGGHGLSIGSVGGRDDNTVSGVTISDSSISNSQNGVRIKTVYGATGSVSGVTYSNIKLSGITSYGIVIEQDYENGSPTGTPTAGVPITGLTVQGVTGTVASGATDVYILCASGACSNWKWSGVSVTGGKTSTKCSNVPSPAKC